MMSSWVCSSLALEFLSWKLEEQLTLLPRGSRCWKDVKLDDRGHLSKQMEKTCYWKR